MPSNPSIAPWLPDFARRRIAPYFEYYRSKKADAEHEPIKDSLDQRSDAPSHILIIVIDALRPDFAPDVPMDFRHIISTSTWTFPSVTSIHTGLLPSQHLSVAHTQPDDEEFAIPAQSNSHPHFPLDLESAGYETYAGLGFGMPMLAVQGWYQTHDLHSARAEEILNRYRSWRQGRERTAAYLHLADLHAPVDPPDEYIVSHNVDVSLQNLAYIRRFYNDFDDDDPECRYYRKQKIKLHQAALDYVSDQITTHFNEIESNTFVIITGDHGEALWEHQDVDAKLTDPAWHYCFGHGGTPFDVVARVPVGISHPGNGEPYPNNGWGSLRDVPATVLDSTVVDRQCPGRSWFSEVPSDRTVICEGTRYGTERKAAYHGENKIIRSRSRDVTLTARITESGERFVDIPDAVVNHLLNVLPDHWDDADNRGSISNFTQSQLEALGYR